MSKHKIDWKLWIGIGISAFFLFLLFRKIDFHKLAAAFRELRPDQREALRLRVIEGRSYRESARVLGCSEDVVRARVSRGLKRLAAQLEE